MKTPAPANRSNHEAAGPAPRGRRFCALGFLAQGDGACHLLGGLRSIFSPLGVQAVTGPKADLCRAQTVGLLLAVGGATFFLAGRARRATRETVGLGAGQAAVPGAVDIWCVADPLTTRACWLDAAVGLAPVGAWSVFARPSGT